MHTDTKTETNYIDFYKQANKNIQDTNYPEKRGLSKAILDRFKIGYVENWKHPNATENLEGSSTPKDLRTLFELIYLRFQAPANDPDGYNNAMA